MLVPDIRPMYRSVMGKGSEYLRKSLVRLRKCHEGQVL
jgi:hypothetical protein